MTPSPQPGLGAFKGALGDPVAKIGAGQVAGNSNLRLGDTPRPRAEGAFSRCAIFLAFWVFSAFKMRVYLGRIVELDREPTCEVGPELAIYRSVTVTGCDEHRGRRGEQAAPFSSAAFQ